MNEMKPVMQKRPGANLLRMPDGAGRGLRLLGACLLGLAVASSVAWSAAQEAKPATGTKTINAQSAQTQPTGDFVGSDTCAGCHTDAVKNFADNPHTKLALQHGKSGASCESCHGPGREHVEGGGDVSKIFNFKTATEKQVTARCLG